ncbi:putative vomeronasal receptor-like protein 4 [Choloepus didactylus]|uniref:putative vomeronasal receptor-like protein 4 n=1 Tax=Choloepus didactylus TaxID=27675 RepID=UPI00189F236A|nr:putative vomeronasal receptor-like protein 4 [Choloepus didactylus]
MSAMFTYVIINKCIVFQAGIGISANTFLFVFCICTFLNCRPKPSELITGHLALIHIVMLFSVIILVSPDLFESLNFQNDVKCKAFFYMNRVMRSLSIFTTCLLSVLQAITISPSSSCLVRFKQKSRRFIFHMLFYIWSLSLSFNSNMIFYTVNYSNMTKNNFLILGKYCAFLAINSIIRSLFSILSIFMDVSFVGMMVLSSAYMVILLYKHRRQSQHLHSTSLSLRTSPEKRATQTILLLMGFFMVMYWVDLIISSSCTMLWEYNPIILGVQRLVVNLYATVSPLVLISSDKRITNALQNAWQKCH